MTNQRNKDWIAAASVAAVLRNEEGSKAVESAYETIIKNAFALKERGNRIMISQVGGLVAECTLTTLADSSLSDALRRLIESGALISSLENGTDFVELSGQVYEDIQAERADRISLKRRVFDAWLDNEVQMEPNLEGHRAELEDVIEEHIGRVISFLASEALVGWSTSADQQPPDPPNLDFSLLEGRSDIIRKVGVEACQRFFKNAGDERLKYLEALLDGYYELQLLRCTQEIQDVFTVQLSDTECYLDTNVLIDLIGINECDCQTELVRQAVAMSVDLGVTVRVAEETRQEYLGLIDEAEKQRQYIRNLKSATDYDHSERSNNASCFLVGFLNELAKNRNLTWGEYKQRYENIPSLLKPYGVVYTAGAKVANREQIGSVANLFENCFRYKRTKAREHDAAMYLLIWEFRRQKGTGIRSWLLTRDFTLSLFDKEAARNLPQLDFPTPCFAIRPHSWIEWLRSRTPGKTAAGIVHLLCELEFTRPKRDSRVVARQIQYMETYRDLDPDLIQSIDCTKILDEELHALGRSSSELSDEEAIALIDKAVMDNANNWAAEGKIAKEQAEIMTELICVMQKSASDQAEENRRIQLRLTEVETGQATIMSANDQLQSLNQRLQLQNRLTIVAVVFVGTLYAMIQIGKWWAYPLILLPLLWWVIRGKGQKKNSDTYNLSSLKDICPLLGACLMVGIELIVYQYLPKTWQPIAKNEFLWIVGFLATASQLYVARTGRFGTKITN